MGFTFSRNKSWAQPFWSPRGNFGADIVKSASFKLLKRRIHFVDNSTEKILTFWSSLWIAFVRNCMQSAPVICRFLSRPQFIYLVIFILNLACKSPKWNASPHFISATFKGWTYATHFLLIFWRKSSLKDFLNMKYDSLCCILSGKGLHCNRLGLFWLPHTPCRSSVQKLEK